MKLNANELKLIALITMIVDHIGVYFAFLMSSEVYSALRIIGRIAMPIYAFFIVQGFLKTSNLKKYIFRISLLAIVSQVLLVFMYKICPREDVSFCITTCNIVFNFALILIVLRMLERNIIKRDIIAINNNKKILDKLIRALIIILVLLIYFIIKIDYGIKLLAMSVCVYLFERLLYYNQTRNEEKIKLNVLKFIELFVIYLFCIIENSRYAVFTIFSLPLIYLYDGTIGNKSKFNKYLFYISFAIQGALLYFLSSLFIR